MANKFIYVEYDKFTNKRESFMSPMSLKEDSCYDDWGYYGKNFSVKLRHFSSPQSDALLMDIKYIGEDWFYLSNGLLIVNINDVENIELEPHESYSRVIDSYISTNGGKCEESVYYEIDKDLLKRICDAKSIDFQIRGDGGAKVSEVNADDFIKYAQVFYNEFYDEEAYKEVFNEKLDFLCPVEDDDDEDDVNSKDAGAGNGCMVTLLMVCGALSSFAFCLSLILKVFL